MINALICDDDLKIIEEATSLIKGISKNKKVDFNIDRRMSGDFVLNEKVSYDIAIIDIEMPGISGLIVSKKIKEYNPDAIVIILTSYSNYLDGAMKIQVFRYLSKPIDKNRFARNFIEALEYYKTISKRIVIEKSYEVSVVNTKDILYIENKRHGSVVVTKTQVFDTNKKPQDWCALIDQPDTFVCSHKSYIVNLQNVINFNRSSITFITGQTVNCVSQRKYGDFKKSFFNFAGGIK